MMAQDRNASGFTLVELLVVVGIISILAAMLLPVVSSAVESGRRAACMSNLKQCGVGMHLYAEESAGWAMFEDSAFNAQISDTTGPGILYGNKIVDTPGIFYCPSSKLAPSWTRAGMGAGSAPVAGWPGMVRSSYSYSPVFCQSGWNVCSRFRLDRQPGWTALLCDWLMDWAGSQKNCPGNHGSLPNRDDFGHYLRADCAVRPYQGIVIGMTGGMWKGTWIATAFDRFAPVP